MSKEKVLTNLKNNIAMENFREVNQKQNKAKKILQSTFTVIICTLSVTGIVFAKEISTKIYDNFFLTGKGMETAMNEGYVENTNMNSETSNTTIENAKTGEIVEDTETKIKVDEFVMDDFNLSMTFDMELSEKAKEVITPEKVWKINFPDMVISDENNIVLFCMTEGRFDKFSQEKQLGISHDEAFENGAYIGSGVNIVPIEREGNHVKVIYNIYTGGDSNYPKSKELQIQIGQIKISKEEGTTLGGEEITLTGNWDFKVAVPAKMYNRTTTIYSQKSTTNEDYKVTSATLYDTGMKVTMEIKTEKMPEMSVSEEHEFYNTLDEQDELKTLDIMEYIFWKERQTEEYRKNSEKRMELYNLKTYLINAKGEKFEMIQGPNENGSMYINENGILKHEVMYDLTKYNQTDIITLHTDYNGVTQEITLEKKEGQ